MYKLKNPILAAALIVTLCLALAACGSNEKKGGDTAIAGTWEMTKIASGSSTLNAEDYLKSANAKQTPVLTFEEDGQVSLDIDGNSGTGTWLEEGGAYKITYTSGEDEVTKDLEVEGDTLKLEQQGYTMTFQKK